MGEHHVWSDFFDWPENWYREERASLMASKELAIKLTHTLAERKSLATQ
jgi:hypothetical protein